MQTNTDILENTKNLTEYCIIAIRICNNCENARGEKWEI